MNRAGRSRRTLSRGKLAQGKVLNDDRADWREAYALFPALVIYAWKKQLLDGAAGVFEGGGAAAEATAGAAQVDVLYRQIGQLKVENDFLSRKLGK